MLYCSNANDLAHYVVNKCYNDGQPVSNLQLQKMLYFLQITFCRHTDGTTLLFPEEFEAWPYGPVIPSVYNEFSDYGGRVIERNYSLTLSVNDAIMSFIDEGIELLRKKSPWDLVRLSHADGSPWQEVYRDGAGYKETISNELLIRSACVGAK